MPDNTTQYGWPYPLSSDLVRDGAEAIEDLAEAIETTLSGTILQVVTASTSTQVLNSTNNYVDTNLTGTITPKATTSRIVVVINQQVWGGATNGFGIRVIRGATTIHDSVTDGTGPFDFHGSDTRANIILVDSPATTSATTYKTQGRRYSSGALYFQGETTVDGKSYITLMEVAA